MDEKTRQILGRALGRYGKFMQLFQTTEELAELIQAISKYRRGARDARANLVEEMADVTNMFWQLQMLADITPEEIGEAVQKKVTRLEERLNAGE